MLNRQISILACQVKVPTNMRTTKERDQHLAQLSGILNDALARKRCDLVLLPELSSISYTRHCFEATCFYEDVNGPTYQALSIIAKKYSVSILYGAPRYDNNQQRYISQFLINNKGQPAGVYDKLHIANFGASMEKDYFTAGSNLLVFEINGIRLAPIICYDMRFASLAQELAKRRKVDVILHPVAFFQDNSFQSWHSFVVTRALENQIYWISLNRAGENFGHSILCPPCIDVNSPQTILSQKETLVYFKIDTNTIKQSRNKYTFLKDELPNYSGL